MRMFVTSQQLAEGWYEKVGCVVFNRQFSGVVKLPDGTYEVDAPPDRPRRLSECVTPPRESPARPEPSPPAG